MAKTSKRPAPIVAVINMKGGVGKTVLSANVFRELFDLKGARTLLIDFDAQFNLSQLLLTQSEYDSLESVGKTIYHVLEAPAPDSVFAVSEEDLAEVGDVDLFTEVLEKHSTAADKDLRLVPGNFQLSILNIRPQPALTLPRLRFKNFIERAVKSYDMIVLDCNPSSSFITLSALEVATHLLVPVKPDRFALRGLQLLSQFIKSVPTLSPGLASRMSILLNDVSNEADPAVVSNLRGHAIFGAMLLVNEVPKSTFFAPKLDYSGFAVDRRVANRRNIKTMLAGVADELSKSLGL